MLYVVCLLSTPTVFRQSPTPLARLSVENFPAVATFIDRIEVTYSHHWQCSTVISLDLIKTLPSPTQASEHKRTNT